MDQKSSINEGNALRIIIAGSSDFNNYEMLREKSKETISRLLSKYPGATITIVSGTARGADQLGERFAKECGYTLKRFPANWKLYRGQAGPVRNRQMLNFAKEKTGILIVFWDGISRGTANMIGIAKEAGIPVFVFMYRNHALAEGLHGVD